MNNSFKYFNDDTNNLLIIHHKYILFSFLLSFFNAYNVSNEIGLIVVGIQILFILKLISSKKYSVAFLLHLFFILTASFGGKVIANSTESIISYTTIELYGTSVRFHMLISVLLILLNPYIRYKNLNKNIFFIGYRMFLIFTLTALVIGVIGLVFDNKYTLFSFNYYFVYSIYILSIFINLINYSSEQFINKLKAIFFSTIIGVFISVIIISILTSFFSIEDINTNFEIMFFTPILILLPFFYKKSIWYSIVGYISIIFLLNSSVSGKGIIFIFFILIIFYYKTFSVKIKGKAIQVYIYLAIILPVIILPFFVNSFFDESKYLSYSFSKTQSLFYFRGLEDINMSPRARILEFINIFYSYKTNIFKLFFGGGFGTYYTDVAGVYSKFTMDNTTFSEYELLSGVYIKAHMTYPTIFLLNGIFGLFYTTYVSLKIFKKSLGSPLLLLPFYSIFFSYGFNPTFALIGILGLYIGTYTNSFNKDNNLMLVSD